MIEHDPDCPGWHVATVSCQNYRETVKKWANDPWWCHFSRTGYHGFADWVPDAVCYHGECTRTYGELVEAGEGC